MSDDQVYVCVQDGSFIVWVLAQGHAWPVSDVASALVMADHIASGEPHGYMHGDDEFVALVGQEGVWWDREPIAEDGPDAAILLAGIGGATVDEQGLDQLIDAIANLEVPLRHDLALCVLLELRDARLELHELSSEIIRQQREIAALRHPLTVGGDPLDENDHRPRRTWHGGHLYHHGPKHWHTFAGRCGHDCDNPLERWADIWQLTICACGGSCA